MIYSRKLTHFDNPTSPKTMTLSNFWDTTSATSVWHIEQLTWRKEILWTCFHKKSYKIDFIRGNGHQPIETDEWKSDTLHYGHLLANVIDREKRNNLQEQIAIGFSPLWQF